jgi:protein-tyrosine phosphatase
VRADSLPRLTETGRLALLDYGVSVVVDLREERDETGVEPLPIPVVHHPIDPRLHPVAWDWPTMREAYLAFADGFRAEFARALTAVGEADPPAAIHCAGGRDRTGIACGMALWLAGVEPEAIAADHALSDEGLHAVQRDWVAEASEAPERERRRRIVAPAGSTLADALEEIEQREGVRQLLLGAGAEAAALDRLVARLRGEA